MEPACLSSLLFGIRGLVLEDSQSPCVQLGTGLHLGASPWSTEHLMLNLAVHSATRPSLEPGVLAHTCDASS